MDFPACLQNDMNRRNEKQPLNFPVTCNMKALMIPLILAGSTDVVSLKFDQKPKWTFIISWSKADDNSWNSGGFKFKF